ASYGVTVHGENKEGWYDQFILDKDLNIVISLSGNFGIEIDSIKKATEVNYFDLALKFTDGVGIVPILSSKLRAIDRNGKTLFETDDEYSIVTATLNNGMIVCTTVINNATMYGAYNTQGKLVVPFEYTNIDPFLGYYTIAEKTVDGSKKQVMLGKDGKELTAMSDFTVPLADMTMGTSTAGKSVAMYKVGCYCSNKVIDGTTYFGVKNLDANVSKNTLIENKMVEGSFLYAPSNNPTSVFVFAKFEKDGAFTIYRLK
ncbi:MAG: WG repeat-containing protein, partial [Clostridia bacterium]|nr:WG repeat-containing protein [Clostridia bacterium]